MSAPFPVQEQWERFYIKPYNPFTHISVPVPVPDTTSVIKPCRVFELCRWMIMSEVRFLQGNATIEILHSFVAHSIIEYRIWLRKIKQSWMINCQFSPNKDNLIVWIFGFGFGHCKRTLRVYLYKSESECESDFFFAVYRHCYRCSINTQIGNNVTGWKWRRFRVSLSL